MPRRQPFTALCQRLAKLDSPLRYDLHTHTTASDGDFTPSQIVTFARLARLKAIAITDHDTLAGVPEAIAAAAGGVEVISGVEITTSYQGREFHLLGYLLAPADPHLARVFRRICDRRRDRFRDFVARLQAGGAAIPADRARMVEERSTSLGQRHVAGLLVACGVVATRTEAFHRCVSPLRDQVVAKERVPIAEAIELVHGAGGVASLAHPPADLDEAEVRVLADYGLDALEAGYPWGRSSPAKKFRDMAAALGLGITGGSDCHGSEPAHRRVGAAGVIETEWLYLQAKANTRIPGKTVNVSPTPHPI